MVSDEVKTAHSFSTVVLINKSDLPTYTVLTALIKIRSYFADLLYDSFF